MAFATKENAVKALEMLEDQSVFIKEDVYEFLSKFVKACKRTLPEMKTLKSNESNKEG